MDQKLFALSEVKTHDTDESLWFVIDDAVYDVTTFLGDHPGGKPILISYGGEDATEGFRNAGHPDDVKDIMKHYKIGELIRPDRADRQRKPQKKSRLSDMMQKSLVGASVVAVALGIGTAVLYRLYNKH